MSGPRSRELWEQWECHLIAATCYRDEVLGRARDCSVWDVDGKEYLDFSAGQICAIVGHQHPELLRRLAAQAEQLTHTGTAFVSPVVFELAARLASLAPGALSKSLFLSTGAEANEYALRLAKAATRRTGVLALTRGYAGLTVATTSLSNFGRGARPLVPDSGFILTPDPTQCPPDRSPLDWARELLHHSLELNRALLDNTAAIIVEPILSAGGLIVLPDGYLGELRRTADRIGALLIADEAQTGVGRTGRWFGVEHDGIVPDILVLSKGVGGGYPLSVVMTTPDVAERAVGHANQYSSHQSDPLAAVAGLAVVDIVEREGLVDHAANTGEYLRDCLAEVASRHPQLQFVRGRGLMNGFDVFRDPARPMPERAVGEAVEDYLRSQGILCEAIQKNRFRLLPPLTLQRAHVDRLASGLDDALTKLNEGRLFPVQAANACARAHDLRRKKGVRASVAWAWRNSPEAWFRRARGRE